eukprot:1715465-Amphidinium_carterae.1
MGGKTRWRRALGKCNFEDVTLDENTIQIVLAVYPAVRDALKRDVLARRYTAAFKGKGPTRAKAREKTKTKGKG